MKPNINELIRLNSVLWYVKPPMRLLLMYHKMDATSTDTQCKWRFFGSHPARSPSSPLPAALP